MPLLGGKPGRVSTNAPRDWPPVVVEGWVRDNPAINYVLVSSSLLEGFRNAARSPQIAFLQELLYPDGLLRVPLLLEEGGQRTGIYVYAEADEAAASHYSAVRALLRQREQMSAVYYAPGPLAPSRPGRALEDLDTPHFSAPAEERPPAEYALWWPTPGEPRLAGSASLTCLDRWFESLDGYACYLFSSLVQVLELAGKKTEEAQVYGLPSRRWSPWTVPRI